MIEDAARDGSLRHHADDRAPAAAACAAQHVDAEGATKQLRPGKSCVWTRPPHRLRRLDGALFALAALSVANPVRGEEDISAFVFSNALLFAWFTALLWWLVEAPASEPRAESAAGTSAGR
jgi:hypothetical protein